MKKILLPLFLLLTVTIQAQLNNSWIDYTKTYYKFKVLNTGLYRISQPALAAINLGNIPADQFQLWRNGEQVRLYTSVPTGPLGTTGYIEFWGKMNDGIPDKPLYRDPNFKLCDSFSLHSDTSSYFLTVNPLANNLRFTETINNVAGNVLPADNYFMRTIVKPFRDRYNRGAALPVGEYVYSSAYDQGEEWTSLDIETGYPQTKLFNGLNVYTAGPANSVSVGVAAFGNSYNFLRNLRVEMGSTIVIDSSMDRFKTIKTQVNNLPLSLFPNPDNIIFSVYGTNTSQFDRIVVGSLSLTYPSRFNFNNEKNFQFTLGASGSGNYIVIDNFNYGSTAPVLYSLNDGKRYVGDIAVAGKVRFALPASTDPARKFLLVNEEVTNISAISNFTTRNFINYSQAANQGDFLIISNPVLYNDGNGVNYVDLYKQYRSSFVGGSFNAKIISIDELTDQFAFGINKHPAAIRDFIRFADQQFLPKAKYVFIIGRGISSSEYASNTVDQSINKIDLVPTFGWPASDMLLSCDHNKLVPLIPIGRIGVVNGTEVKYYLNKVKEHELAQASLTQTVGQKGWMKNVIHVSGGRDSTESAQFRFYLDSYKSIIEDTLYGADVESFNKTTNSAVQQASGLQIEQLINGGVSLIGYFGHSSANTLAFNLSSPEIYTNQGKYPMFNVSGCSAGNYFIYDPTRLSGNLTISEKFVLAENRGSIGFIASTHLGIPPYLNQYNRELYTALSKTMYGNSIGNQMKRVSQLIGSVPVAIDYYTRINLEEINLQGDPAIKLNAFSLPDYVIEDQLVKISPNVISVADANFSLSVKMLNIGKAIKDSMRVYITRKLPNDTVKVIFNQKIRAILNNDSLNFVIPINPITDKGLNKITITLDADNAIAESSETNNTVSKDFYIFEDELRPVFPYNYSIVNQQNITYTASTANPLTGQRQYVMEIDTTELFNSPFKKQYTQTGPGGAIQFTPANITFTDSTVYYWRTSITPVNSNPVIWNAFSFVYLPTGGSGFNQSHYYQQLHSSYSNSLSLDADKVYRFKDGFKTMNIKTGLYPFVQFDRINVNLDFDQLEYYGCKYNSLQIMVYDTITLRPWKNFNTAGSGRFGSWPVCDTVPGGTRNFFEFPYTDFNYRKKAMDFLDQIPAGMFVSITNLGRSDNTSFIDSWKADTTTWGSGNSLYHKLKAIGFDKIDSFSHNLPFLYFYKKNSAGFLPRDVMGLTEDAQIDENIILASKFRSGTITSPLFGPARNWQTLHWRGKSLDASATADTVKIEVYGVKSDGTEVLMTTVTQAQDTTLAFINGAIYPYVKLKMLNTDEENATPYQLRYWRINAGYLPEGALAPNILFTMKDTLAQGDKIDFAIAFKNVSNVAFADSIKIKLIITDKNNVANLINIPKKKALISGDTLTVRYSIDSRNFSGLNTLYLMVNPDNDQPEQYLFNNVLYKDFYVERDRYNPLLDVTFDGVHILNNDIVSAKPNILIKLKDENKYLALADTSLLTVQVKFPPLPGSADGELRTYHFGDIMQFIPANLTNGENTATINLKADFPLNGDYQLIVTGKDVVGNIAGNQEHLEYRQSFMVENRPMISNMLNYPNPFTTSTAFVFTLTGSQVPQNIRIQILTITGKVVREITKAELGPIHIGNNITEFKWDGTDMYGQKLANGVYLYRVITNLNGRRLDKFDGRNSNGDTITEGLNGKSNIDQYFNKGYGKMYLMR